MTESNKDIVMENDYKENVVDNQVNEEDGRDKFIICLSSPSDKGKTESVNRVIKDLCQKQTLAKASVFDSNNQPTTNWDNMQMKDDHIAFIEFPGIKVGIVTVGDPYSSQEEQLNRVIRWDIQNMGEQAIPYSVGNAPDIIVCTARAIDPKSSYYKSPEEIVKGKAKDYNYNLIWASQYYTDWCDFRSSYCNWIIPILHKSTSETVVKTIESLLNITL